MRRRLPLLLAAGLALAPHAAQAHLVVTGMGPVYDGIVHFAFSAEDSLPTAALALYAGLQGPRHARWSLMALTAAWILGGVAGAAIGPGRLDVAYAPLTAALMIGIGALLASNASTAAAVCAMIAVLAGGLRGCADGAGDTGGLLSVVGMAASAFVVFALAASLTLRVRRFWPIVAVRVAGSWLAAMGLLFAGWIWRYGGGVS